MSVRRPQCLSCTRFDWKSEAPLCEAFPGGIPEAIYYGGVDHRRKFADEALLYEPENEEARREVEAFWGRRPRRSKPAEDLPGGTVI